MQRKIAFQENPAPSAMPRPTRSFRPTKRYPAPPSRIPSPPCRAARPSTASSRSNSLYGRITDIYHLLPESGLFITGEHFLATEMEPPQPEQGDAANIERNAVLLVALGPCRKLVHGRASWTVDSIVPPGSGRRRDVAEKGDRIGRRHRALPPRSLRSRLSPHIEDATRNTTRFLVISKRPDGRRRAAAR